MNPIQRQLIDIVNNLETSHADQYAMTDHSHPELYAAIAKKSDSNYRAVVVLNTADNVFTFARAFSKGRLIFNAQIKAPVEMNLWKGWKTTPSQETLVEIDLKVLFEGTKGMNPTQFVKMLNEKGRWVQVVMDATESVFIEELNLYVEKFNFPEAFSEPNTQRSIITNRIEGLRIIADSESLTNEHNKLYSEK